MCNFFLLNKIQVTLNLRHSFAKTEKKKERTLKKKIPNVMHTRSTGLRITAIFGDYLTLSKLSRIAQQKKWIYSFSCVYV